MHVVLRPSDPWDEVRFIASVTQSQFYGRFNQYHTVVTISHQ